MGAKWRFALLYLASSVALAQSATKGLGLTLKTRQSERGFPALFEVSITNESDHDIRLPDPAIECDSSFTGRVGISFRFIPAKAVAQGDDRGYGCAADTMKWPFILDRVQHWNVLSPGQSLTVAVTPEQMHCDCVAAGRYEFWAGYLPPYVSSEEQHTLHNSGIYIPTGAISSAHLVINKP